MSLSSFCQENIKEHKKLKKENIATILRKLIKKEKTLTLPPF